MAITKLDERFFESTRGKLVLLLRNAKRTVNELAEELGLSDNAVRAHLLTLERDGLIEAAGTVKGFRKPHFSYRLTAEARHLFPKPYDTLFNRLLDSLKGRVNSTTLNEVLIDTGRRLALVNAKKPEGDLSSRIDATVKTLGDLGGAARVVNEDSRTKIQSESCPFADAAVEHPEVCRIAESMIEEMIGHPVKEICDRSSSPKCCFVIETS